MIEPCGIVDEVRRRGGSIVLLIYVDRPPAIDLRLPREARWLVEEVRQHRPEVVTELKRRYLTGTVLSERVQ
jgi:hypothetical protein